MNILFRLKKKIYPNEESLYYANKAFYMLFGVFIVLIVLLISLLVKVTPLTISHTVYYCQKVFYSLIVTLPQIFPALISITLLIVLATGFSLFVYKLAKTYFYINQLLNSKVRIPKRIKIIANRLGILDKIDIVRTNHYLSFCYGFLHPRICLSTRVVKLLDGKELESVLIHEIYHLQNKDPLKLLLGQVAVNMFFFVPILKDLHNYYALSKEVAADRLTVKMHGVNNLKSALIKMLNIPSPRINLIASFAEESSLEKRIIILANRGSEVKVRTSLLRIITSFFVFAFVFIFLNLPVYALEDNNDNHSYFICPFGDNCMLSCTKEGMINEIPFSRLENFTPMNYSPNRSN